MDKLDFYIDMMYSVQDAMYRMKSKHSLTEQIAFTYEDLKDLKKLLKNAITNEIKEGDN